MSHIAVDYKKCRTIAMHIKSLGGVPPDQEDPMPYTFPACVAENGWCAVVAINHQTTPIVGQALRGTVNGITLRGWDYLLQKAIHQANGDPHLFTVQWLSAVTVAQLCDLFYDAAEGTTLTRIEGRAEILNDLGRFLSRNAWDSIHGAYIASQGFIVRNDGKGLAQILARTKGFADPVRKKTFYFLALMQNLGFWRYKDIENLSSPVNYHEQRGHLRIGTVRITDPDLEQKIRAREEITYDEDIEIRFAVRRAIEYIAKLLTVTPSAMHYFFWNYFRNCCSRDNTHCTSCATNCRLPDRYRLHDITQCVFAPVCTSANIGPEHMLIEPRLDNTIWQ